MIYPGYRAEREERKRRVNTTMQNVKVESSWAVSKARTVIASVLVRRQGYARGEAVRYFARDSAALGALMGRLTERLAEDEELRREIDRLSKKVEI